jgi:outer membrane protein assembly factor BamB
MTMLWTQVLLIIVGLSLSVWGLMRMLESMRLDVPESEAHQLRARRWRWVVLMGLGDTLLIFAIILIVLHPEGWQELFQIDQNPGQPEKRDVQRIERLLQQPLPQPDQATRRPADSAVEGNPVSLDWPGWRGPHRDGIVRETGLLDQWPESGLPVLWRTPIGGGYSSPVVASGRVFVMDYRKPDERLVCFDVTDGKMLGEYRWRVAYRDIDTRWGGDYGPRGTPAIAGRHIYALGADGDLVCCEAEPKNGALPVVWHKHLFQEFPPQLPSTWWGLSGSPLVVDNLVIVIVGNAEGCVLAFDRITGELKWKALKDKPAYSSPVLANMPVAPQIRQVVVLTAARIAGLELTTGELLWSYPWTTDYDCNIATPIVAGNYVFVSTDYGRGSVLLEISRGNDGKWQADAVYQTRKFQNHIATSVLVGDRLYGFNGYSPARLTCLNFRTGELIWETRREIDKGCLLYADGRLIVFTEKGELVLVEPGETGFTIRGRFRVFPDSHSTWALPAVSNGRLFVRNDRELVCLNLRK